MRPRRFWMIALPVIIVAGILSRTVHSGFVLFDKYLGDALYAAMIYAIVRMCMVRNAPVVSVMLMIAIECFQLTGIAARLLASDSLPVRIVARLLGTDFSFLDLVAYSIGIAASVGVDRMPPVTRSRSNSVQGSGRYV